MPRLTDRLPSPYRPENAVVAARLSALEGALDWAGAAALAALMCLAGASMAGLIPLFGFATKEKALVALLDADASAQAGMPVR